MVRVSKVKVKNSQMIISQENLLERFKSRKVENTHLLLSLMMDLDFGLTESLLLITGVSMEVE